MIFYEFISQSYLVSLKDSKFISCDLNLFCTISWRKGLATWKVINRRIFFHPVFFFSFSSFIFAKRGLRRRRRRLETYATRTSCSRRSAGCNIQSSRPCFSLRQHPRNWRLRGLRQADKTTKNGKTCSSSCVGDETAIITCSNAHRSLERGTGYPPPFRYLRYTDGGYKRNLDASGSVYRIRFISTVAFCAFCATRLVEPNRPLTTVNRRGNFLQFSEGY